MKLLPLVNVALGATFSRFKSHTVDPIECGDGSVSELEINEDLDIELIEGDIVPNVNEMNIQTDLSYRWPGAKLYVDVLPEVDYNVVGVLHQAIRELEAKSNVRFKRYDNEDDYIVVYNGGGCSSSVGRQGGRQSLSLGKGCDRMATIMHEFTHAMGVMHTQSRPDRDDHIVIHWENIPVNRWNNFAKVEGNAWTTFDMPYNYMSVMHYSGYGFSTNGEYTIETIDPFYQGLRYLSNSSESATKELIGQRASYTAQDTKNIELIYSYDENDANRENCQCDIVEISGCSIDSSNGLYYKEDQRPILQNITYRWDYVSENDHQLTYKRLNYQWVVNNNRPEGARRVLQADSQEICADNISFTDGQSWQEREPESGEWEDNENIQINCATDDGYCCSVRVSVILWPSICNPFSAIEYSGIVYQIEQLDRLERPKYRSSSGDEIVYSNGEWKIIQSGKISKVLGSKRFCLENTLTEFNLDFKCLGDSDVDTLNTSDGTDDDDSFWKIENWAHIYAQIQNGQYISSLDVTGKPFKSKEGYAFEMRVYPKGRSESYEGSISIYAYQVQTDEDEGLVWPLHGKQITMGIVEQGKEINERVTMRRAFYTSPPEESWRPSDWLEPSENIGNRGWGSFLTHDLLFYKEWNYVYEDSMLFSFRITEVTGVFLNCEVTNFDRCLYKQEQEDDLDLDTSGAVYERGLVRITSIPTVQWGLRCLAIDIDAGTSYTLSVTLNFVDGTDNYPVFRERIYPNGPSITQTKVELGFEDYFSEVQQYVTIEILNHEDEKVRLAKIEQLYGPC